MGLRDKVALMLVSILITQVTLILSMPRSTRKEALKHYLGNFNQCKSIPLSGRGLKSNNKPARPSNFKKTNNAKINSNVTPTKSIHKTYNFPETEYPLDTSPRDPYYWGKNANPFDGLKKQVCIPQPQIINDLKKERRLNRKLNRASNTDYQTKREMPSHTVPFNDHETFPQVEYPMTAMETWGPHYWNTMFNQNGEKNNLDFQTPDPKAVEKSTIFYKPKQILKSKTKQYVEEMDRLKGKMQKVSAASTLKPAAQDAVTIPTSNASSKNFSKSDSNTTTVLPVINKTDIESKEDQSLLNVNITENSEQDDPKLLSDIITDTPKITDKEIVTSEIDSDIILMTPIPVLYINLDVCPVTDSNNTENATMDTIQRIVGSANEEISEYLDEFNIPNVNTPSFHNETNSEIIDLIKSQFQTIESTHEAPLDVVTIEDIDLLTANITDYLNVCLVSDNTTQVPQDEDFESPVNTKIPIAETNVSEHISSLQTSLGDTASTIEQSHVEKVPYTSVIVVPVGDSVKEIQLPTIESNTGAPIIIFVPATHGSEKPITSVDSTKAISSDTVVPSDLSYNDVPNKSISEIPTQNDPSNMEYMTIPPATTTIEPQNTNNQSILIECENLPINSMCYGIEDTSITSTSETNQDFSAFDRPFLEMLQPIIAITDTASQNFPAETYFISDLTEMAYNLKDNLTLSETPFTVVLPLSITEDYSSVPDLAKYQLPTSTWVIEDNINHPDNFTLIHPTDIPVEKDPAILDMNFFDVINENLALQDYDINGNELPMPIDLVLPMDVIIDMIKNGKLIPLHDYIQTPVIDIQTGPMGPVAGIFSNNVPINKFEADAFEMPNDALQAMEIQGVKSFTNPTDLFLPIKKLEANSQSTESAENVLPVLLDKYVTNDHSSDFSDIAWIPMEKETLKPVNTNFNYYNGIEKSMPFVEDAKNIELPTSKANIPSKDVSSDLNKNNTLLMYTNKFEDAPMSNIENSLYKPTNIITSSHLPINIEEHSLEQADDDKIADLIKYTHEDPKAMKFHDVQSLSNSADKPSPIKELVPSTQITENHYNTSFPLDEVIQSNTSDGAIENDNMIFMLDEAVTESPSIDIIEDYIPFQMNNIQDTPFTDKEEPNKDNYSPNTLNSDIDMHLPIANKEIENHKNERNGDPLESFDVDTVQNFNKLHSSPFAKTKNIKDSGLNKAPKDTATSYLSEEELLPATKDVKDLL